MLFHCALMPFEWGVRGNGYGNSENRSKSHGNSTWRTRGWLLILKKKNQTLEKLACPCWLWENASNTFKKKTADLTTVRSIILTKVLADACEARRSFHAARRIIPAMHRIIRVPEGDITLHEGAGKLSVASTWMGFPRITGWYCSGSPDATRAQAVDELY